MEVGGKCHTKGTSRAHSATLKILLFSPMGRILHKGMRASPYTLAMRQVEESKTDKIRSKPRKLGCGGGDNRQGRIIGQSKENVKGRLPAPLS